ncbi:MAG: hypothetical protein WEC75_01505 [Dehalococcoidia bacterium]
MSIACSAVRSAPTIKDYLFARAGERGQDLVEYAVLVGGIGLIVAFALFTGDIGGAAWQFADQLGACVSFEQNGGQCELDL